MISSNKALLFKSPLLQRQLNTEVASALEDQSCIRIHYEEHPVKALTTYDNQTSFSSKFRP